MSSHFPRLRSYRLHLLAVAAVLVASTGCTRQPVPPSPFEAARAMTHVERLCAFGPRVPNSAARDSATAYIAHTLEGDGAHVSVEAFRLEDPYGGPPLRLMNVIASFAPERTRRVLLCAHYDSRPRADEDPDSTRRDQPILGAVDGAAGTAILMEVGRVLGERLPDHIGVDLVFFDGEDYGRKDDVEHYLLGSRHFVAHMAGYRPAHAILLDMVGGVGTHVAREGYSQQHARALCDTLFARAASLGLHYFRDEDGAPMVDDHVPLLQAGVPTVDLFGYGYPYWHTLQDTADKVDSTMVQQVGTLLSNFVYNYPFH